MRDHGFLPGTQTAAARFPLLFHPIDRRKTGIRFLANFQYMPEAAHVDEWYVSKADGDQDRPN